MPIQTPICDFGQKAHDFKLKSTDGKILNIEGKEIGEHDGIINYTIGQRKGIKISFSN